MVSSTLYPSIPLPVLRSCMRVRSITTWYYTPPPSITQTKVPNSYCQRQHFNTFNLTFAYTCIYYCPVKHKQIPYSGNFSLDSIFTDGPSLPLCGFNFRGCVHSHPVCTIQIELISWVYFLQLGGHPRKSRKLDPSFFK